MLPLKSKKSFFLHLFTFIFYHIQREVNMEIQHNSSVKAIIYMIDNCGMSPSDIENKTKISRTQVYRWRDGTVKNVRTSSLHNVAKALGYKIHHIDNTITTIRGSDNNIFKEKEKTMKPSEGQIKQELLYEHIDLLKEKIAMQSSLIEKLDEEKGINALSNEPLNVIYEETVPDFTSVVHIKNIISKSKMSRMIERADNLDNLSNALNTSEKHLIDNYFDYGNWHLFNHHPVNKMIIPDSLKELQAASSTLTTMKNMFKFSLGAFYMKFTIVYFIKKSICITSSYIKIKWGTKPYIETKNIIYKDNFKS